jgi:dihydroorotase
MMTLTFGPDINAAEIEAAKTFGVVGIKWYPAGGTVNADTKSGNIRLDPADKRFEAMEKNDMPFLIHAQRPLIWSRDGEYTEGGPAQAERDMLSDVIALAKARPNLKIVIEHISTKEACEVVRQYPNVSCTVTPQHLIYDDADIRK